MPSTTTSLVIVALLVLGMNNLKQTDAQQAKSPSAEAIAKSKIVPVVMIKPGETKELLLSTLCSVGISRSGGLDIRETGHQREGFQSSTLWQRDGVKVELPDFGEARKVADSELFAPLKAQGIDAFYVKVTATKDAKSGIQELHIADFTCNGTCQTDLRVFVAK